MTGTDLRTAREAKGLSQERLAALVEPPLKQTHVSAMEHGRRPIGTGMAARFREALAKAKKGAK
jgi:transcriptional regulator with XRE-family HTH domain